MYNDDVSQLKKFVDKYHNGILTVDDIKSLNIELSIGTIKCVKFDD